MMALTWTALPTPAVPRVALLFLIQAISSARFNRACPDRRIFRSAILDYRELPNRQAPTAGVDCSDREQTHSLISLGRSDMSFVARRLTAFSAAVFLIAASGSSAL